MKTLNIGWAQVSITPDRPVYVPGQLYTRVSKYVHDPVTATALVIEDGNELAAFLSLDMVGPANDSVRDMARARLRSLEGFDPDKLIICATHTHNSVAPAPTACEERIKGFVGAEKIPPVDRPDNMLVGEEFERFLAGRMCEAVERAWNKRAPGGVSCAQDYACVGFNRRPVFAGGESIMYGDCSRSDFVGYEGGVDHSFNALFTWDEAGELTGVAACVPCPSQVFELHSFITADYWGYARDAIRRRLGNVFVLPLCGAAGDQNPLDLTRISHDNKRALLEWGAQAGEVFRNFDMADECRGIADRIGDAAARAYERAKNSIAYEPELKHERMELKLPLRKISEAEYDYEKARLEALVKRFKESEGRMTGADLVASFEPMGAVARWELQQKGDTVTAVSHALRIGDAAIVTAPFELFVEYSQRIKARSAARKTFVVQLSEQSLGYLPTRAAIAGGSYSSKPASTMCGPDGGDMLVESALTAIDSMF